MIDFPTPISVGQVYTYLARSWVWNGSGWERLLNSGQIVSVFFNPGLNVSPIGTFTVSEQFTLLNYV